MKRIREVLDNKVVLACVAALCVCAPLAIHLAASGRVAHAEDVTQWMPWSVEIDANDEGYSQSEPSVTLYGADWLYVVFIDEWGMREEAWTRATVIIRQNPPQEVESEK